MEEMLLQIDERLKRIERLLSTSRETLDVKEAAVYTGYSPEYIYKLTSGRHIPFYKRGNKVFFSRVELDNWMKSNRTASDDELAIAARSYCLDRPLKFGKNN